MTRRAVVLLSGGLDSATVLAVAKTQGHELYALTVDYGQRHHREIDCAKAQAKAQQVAEHRIVRVELPAKDSSVLTSPGAVPAYQPSSSIPPTYVPARNTILLSLALSWAESLGAEDIFIGVTAVDYSGYPDCRGAFIDAFQNLANLATKAAIQEGKFFRIQAPLLKLGKHEIIARAVGLAVDFSKTNSCYDPDDRGRACGRCDSCVLRLKGFSEAGLADPLEYA
ncbi:MAG: 7-cyano-7-deazaguanine synthase QueC [Actinobacteria bacterium]|nr:7-cyano-7-deazaguanine synthase QueC [Actinomycetota bacterium]